MKKMMLAAAAAMMTFTLATAQTTTPPPHAPQADGVRKEHKAAPAGQKACPEAQKEFRQEFHKAHKGAPGQQMKQADPKQMALHKAMQLKKELDLTADQQDKVFQAYKQFFDAKFAPGQEKKADDSQMTAAREKLTKKMQKILNGVQFAQWQQGQLRGHQGHPAHQGHKRPQASAAARPQARPAVQPAVVE